MPELDALVLKLSQEIIELKTTIDDLKSKLSDAVVKNAETANALQAALAVISEWQTHMQS